MSDKRKRKLKKRESRQAKLRQRSASIRPVVLDAVAVRREADHVTESAAAQDARIVTLGVLVFFSTATGDAWMLDAEDDLAICLSRAGERTPPRIIETETQFGIDWQAAFSIESDLFCTVDRHTGRAAAIHGYPIQEILAAIGRIRG
jgi:hypothetical protein